MAGAAMAVPIAINPGDQIINDAHQVVVTPCTRLDDRHPGGGVRNEDVE